MWIGVERAGVACVESEQRALVGAPDLREGSSLAVFNECGHGFFTALSLT